MKLSKIMNVIVCITLAINLVIQLLAMISLTKSSIGKKIRRAILKGSCNYMDDSIDVVQEKMPDFMKKIESISDSIEQ